jgi:hypothetical protein
LQAAKQLLKVPKVLGEAERTAAWLRGFAASPLELLTALRFQPVGHDPLTGEPLN